MPRTAQFLDIDQERPVVTGKRPRQDGTQWSLCLGSPAHLPQAILMSLSYLQSIHYTSTDYKMPLPIITCQTDLSCRKWKPMYCSSTEQRSIQAARSRGQRQTQHREVMWERDEQEAEPGGATAQGSGRCSLTWSSHVSWASPRPSPLCSMSGRRPEQTHMSLNSCSLHPSPVPWDTQMNTSKSPSSSL